MQSLGQEAICRSETNWDLGLGKFTWIHLGFPSCPYASFLRIHELIHDSFALEL